MGRLPSLTRATVATPLLVALVIAGCDEQAKPTSAPQARSQGVEATGTATSTAPTIATVAAPAQPQERPVLCAHQLGTGKDVPKGALSHAGKTPLPEKLPAGEGHWTWVNLWAAWCVPCKEEIPRLKAWEGRTAGERVPLKVAFVSMDDDARQLETFLGAQPPAGLQSTYWLKDGPERGAWLKEAGFSTEPELPAHLLIDPAGKVRCRQQGAIEDGDFPEVLKILRGERGSAVAGEATDVPRSVPTKHAAATHKR